MPSLRRTIGIGTRAAQTPSGLAVVISANAIQAAPVGLAVTIASAATIVDLGGAGIYSSNSKRCWRKKNSGTR